MAITYGAIGTGASPSAVTSIAVPYPAGITAGNLLVAFLAGSTNSKVFLAQSGWTLGQSSKFLYKIADGSETGSITLSFNAATTGRCIMARYNSSFGLPIEFVAGHALNSSTNFLVTPSDVGALNGDKAICNIQTTTSASMNTGGFTARHSSSDTAPSYFFGDATIADPATPLEVNFSGNSNYVYASVMYFREVSSFDPLFYGSL